MARRLAPEIENAIQRVAQARGMDPAALRAFVLIESGGNPNTTTGSYRGLLQLSDQQFRQHGGQGNIYDTDANLTAGAGKLQAMSSRFERQYGRKPSASELYMMHQQGEGGAAAHWANPDQPAWKSMASTAEGREKGDAWAKRAIWGNVPDDVKARYGSVDNLTSRDFTGMWGDKVARFSGAPGPEVSPLPQGQAVAATSPSPAPTPAMGAGGPYGGSQAVLPLLASAFGLPMPGSMPPSAPMQVADAATPIAAAAPATPAAAPSGGGMGGGGLLSGLGIPGMGGSGGSSGGQAGPLDMSSDGMMKAAQAAGAASMKQSAQGIQGQPAAEGMNDLAQVDMGKLIMALRQQARNKFA